MITSSPCGEGIGERFPVSRFSSRIPCAVARRTRCACSGILALPLPVAAFLCIGWQHNVAPHGSISLEWVAGFARTSKSLHAILNRGLLSRFTMPPRRNRSLTHLPPVSQDSFWLPERHQWACADRIDQRSRSQSTNVQAASIKQDAEEKAAESFSLPLHSFFDP